MAKLTSGRSADEPIAGSQPLSSQPAGATRRVPFQNVIKRAYGLGDHGARVFMRGVVWTALAGIANLLPVVVLLLASFDVVAWLKTGGAVTIAPWKYLLAILATIIALYLTQARKYTAVFCDTYEESSRRRLAIAETLRKLPLSFFGKRDLGDLTALIMEDAEFSEHALSHAIPQMWGTLAFVALAAVGLLACDWRLALASLWVVPAALAVVLVSRKRQGTLNRELTATRLATSATIRELIECAPDIRACNRLEGTADKLEERFAAQERVQGRYELTASVALTSARVILQLGFGTLLLAGAALLAAGSLSWQAFLLFAFVAPRLYDPLVEALSNILEVFAADTSNARLTEIEQHPVATGSTEFNPANYDLAFNQVDFAYREGEPVLEHVTFTTRQGQVTALVGPSGSGKSTAAALAARLWEPSGGSITLGGVNVADIDPETLLSAYAEVFQDVMLFDGTIRDNIRLGKMDATDAEIEAAASAAQCDDFVGRLPRGLDTEIAKDGALLSGGQRQRISIARALLKDAPVVLLDEATASVDPESETRVQEAIGRLTRGKTVLVVAHRMRTVLGADRVVVLDGGRVREEGTPREQLAQDGAFAHLCKLQGLDVSEQGEGEVRP